MMHKYTFPGRSLLILFLICFLISCSANLDKCRSFKTIFDHYREKDGITAIGFPPGLLSLVLDQGDHEQSELKNLMKELSSFSMLIIEDGSEGVGLKGELSSHVTDYSRRNDFEDLFQVQTGGENLFIRIQEKEGMVREAILMFNAENSFAVIDLRGNIDIKHFTRLVEGGYLQELTELSNLDI